MNSIQLSSSPNFAFFGFVYVDCCSVDNRFALKCNLRRITVVFWQPDLNERGRKCERILEMIFSDCKCWLLYCSVIWPVCKISGLLFTLSKVLLITTWVGGNSERILHRWCGSKALGGPKHPGSIEMGKQCVNSEVCKLCCFLCCSVRLLLFVVNQKDWRVLACCCQKK